MCLSSCFRAVSSYLVLLPEGTLSLGTWGFRAVPDHLVLLPIWRSKGQWSVSKPCRIVWFPVVTSSVHPPTHGYPRDYDKRLTARPRQSSRPSHPRDPTPSRPPRQTRTALLLSPHHSDASESGRGGIRSTRQGPYLRGLPSTGPPAGIRSFSAVEQALEPAEHKKAPPAALFSSQRIPESPHSSAILSAMSSRWPEKSSIQPRRSRGVAAARDLR